MLKHGNCQVKLHSPMIARSAAADNALALHDMGLNVFPINYGCKHTAMKWRPFQFSRLDRDALYSAFQQNNIAVVTGYGGLLVIDCETPDALYHHAHEMSARNIPLFVVQTARGGHIYIRLDNGCTPQNIPSGVMTDCEIKGAGGYVVGVGSLHPSGAIYDYHPLHNAPAPPVVNADSIDWITDKAGRKLELPIKGRTSRYQAFLDAKGNIPPGERNERLYRAACSARGTGVDMATAQAKLTAAARATGLPIAEIQATIKRGYKSDNQADNRQAKIDRLAAIADTFTGRTRDSDRRVWLALLQRYKQDALGKPAFSASERHLAEIAQLARATVVKSLRRLINDHGLIVRTRGDGVSATYKLTATAHNWTRKSDVVCKVSPLKAVTAPTGLVDYFCTLTERRALGHTGLTLYRATLAAAHTIAELAALTGYHRSTVSRHIRKLSAYGLVSGDGGRPQRFRGIAHTASQLHHAVVVPSGALQAEHARRRRHERERAKRLFSLCMKYQDKNHRASPPDGDKVTTITRDDNGCTPQPLSMTASNTSTCDDSGCTHDNESMTASRGVAITRARLADAHTIEHARRQRMTRHKHEVLRE